MTTSFSALIVSGFVSILTIFGVRFVDYMAKRNESASKLQGKEFDDGIERRKELIREIDGYKETIIEKDKQILASNSRIETLKDEITKITIEYIKLEGNYDDVIEALAKFSEELATKFKSKSVQI